MFVFYDTEATGLEKQFCQILQIGLIFTDDDLNLLASKKTDSRRAPWVVPSPEAMLITHFTPDDLKKAKNSHYEMMKDTDQWIRSQNWPVIFGGYSSVQFDDVVLAYNLGQNLLDPGMTTASAGNGRANGRFDVHSLVCAAATYMPGSVKLDIKNHQGSPSLSLVNVAAQNGVSFTGAAHDAMFDIRATVGVAKVIKKSAPQVWDQMVKMATEAGVTEFCEKNKVFAHTTVLYSKMKTEIVTSVATREGGTTEALFDLSVDPTPYLSMSIDELKKALNADDTPFRKAPKHNQPIFMPMDLAGPALPQGYDEKLFESRADAIKANAAFRANVAAAVTQLKNERPPLQNPDPEQLLYPAPEGKLKVRIDTWAREFHAAAGTDWKAASALIGDFHKRFGPELKTDPYLRRFAHFATRIVFEHAPQELSADTQEKMKRFIAQRILDTDPEAPYMTIPKARKSLEAIRQDRKARTESSRWKDVTDSQLRSLALYYTAIEKEYAPYLPKTAANDAAPLPDAKKAANDRFRPRP